MKKYLIAVVYTVLLALFTLYTVMDTFVLKKAPNIDIPQTLPKKITSTPVPKITLAPDNVERNEAGAGQEEKGSEAVAAVTPVATSAPSPTFTPTPTLAPTWSTDGYVDSNMTVKITKYREYDSDIYVVDATVNSVDLLKTELASAVRPKSEWEITSDISKACGEGLIISVNGDCWMSRTGYSIKNGVLLRDTITKVTKGFTRSEPLQEDLVIFSDGSAKIIKEGDYTAQELLDMGAWQLFNFGPALIDEGKNVSKTSVSTTEVASSRNPRTAIGLYDDLHYVFIVVDGRNGATNRGVTCSQLAEFGMSLGLKYLYNLDGGGSATLYFQGEVLNQPCRNGSIKEVTVSDIIYIGY